VVGYPQLGTIRALVAGAGGPRQQGKATFTVNGKEAAKGQLTEDNADVLRQLDLKDHVRAGPPSRAGWPSVYSTQTG
jgi:hypothetical protein